MKTSHLLLASVVALALPANLRAWGPHSEITQAAMDTLATGDPLIRQLGDQFRKLRAYCWMADWRRQLHREADVWFYTDDYLLFPAMTTHRDHLCPEVKQTYDPYFRRALQALRTETPANAARWIGSILHFTEDTGAPPHAAEIRGDVHSKMENWVDAQAINPGEYRPQLLGKTDDEAVPGFLKRMDGLIAFSKQRAERAKPFVLSGDRASTEPIVLESAIETSRVVADLLHTFGYLAEQLPASAATLRGVVASQAPPGFEKLPAKVVLFGTTFSTLADPEGRYEFRNLPAGTYRAGILRAGSAVHAVDFTLSARQTAVHDFTLSPDEVPVNMLRNSAFRLNWLAENQPDAWYPKDQPDARYPIKHRTDAPFWEGELVPLNAGTNYRLQAKWPNTSAGQVVVRLLSPAVFAKLPTELKPLMPGETELIFPATKDTAYAQVLIYAEGSPSAAIDHLSLTPVP